MEIIDSLSNDLKVDRTKISKLVDGLSIQQSAEAIAYVLDHPDYQLLAGRIRCHYIKSNLIKPYSKAVLDPRFKKILSDELIVFVTRHSEEINRIIEEDEISSMRYAWVSIRTLEKGYLKRFFDSKTKIVHLLEDVSYAIMRICIHIFATSENPLENIRDFYHLITTGQISPASPVWFNAGTRYPQMKSCFLTRVGDNIESIMQCYTDTALVSKEGGGNGVHIGDLRHSTVRTAGESGGIFPWMHMWDKQAIAIDQGGNRKGAFTFFLPDFHKDSPEFIDLRLPEGSLNVRTHHLNLCVWASDLFFRRVCSEEKWSFFCPNIAKGLTDLYGADFERQYIQYENSEIVRSTVNAKDHFENIVRNMITSGQPFMMSADACNSCSNQKNEGIHTGSNLCLEIVEIADDSQIAACNLISIRLSAFVVGYGKDAHFDFIRFGEICRKCVRFLNQVTKVNYYPVNRIKTSDDAQFPIGIGTQDFDGVLKIMDMPWEFEFGVPNPAAMKLKEKIWACKYYWTLYESSEAAEKIGKPYPGFKSSPLAQGVLQFDMWDNRRKLLASWNLPGFEHVYHPEKNISPSDWGDVDHTWDTLRKKIKKHGVANSLLNCDMPTATQAHIQGSTECFEPLSYVLYVKNLLAGDCYIFNAYFVKDLEDIGFWGIMIVEFLKVNNGSIKGLTDYIISKTTKYLTPEVETRLRFIELKYKTAYEISAMTQSDFIAASSRYVCQSSSSNVYFDDPSTNDIYNLILYRWMLGLKCLMYYLRTQPVVDPMKYTVKRDDKKKEDTGLLKKKMVGNREIECVGCE